MVQISPVRTKDQANSVYTLAFEFIDWLRDRYPEMEAEINTYLVHQKFDEQIRDVLVHFTPPKGECLLAMNDDVPIGILMLKDLGNGICEMNRMFVQDNDRGLGADRGLVASLKVRATEMGFQTMVLSALPRR